MTKPGATLIILLVVMIVAITVTTASVMMIVGNSQGASDYEQGLMARNIAESGVENAFLRLLRDPTYSGETLTVGQGSSTITVTGGTPQVITSRGQLGNFVRSVSATVTYSAGILTISPIREIY